MSDRRLNVRPHTTRWLAVLLGLLATCAPALAQDPDPQPSDRPPSERAVERAARAAAFRWLTTGKLAPRPELGEAEFGRVPVETTRATPAQGGGELFHYRFPPSREAPLQFTVDVTRGGEVVDYFCGDQSMEVALFDKQGERRADAEREAERVRRTRYDRDAIEALAQAFVAARVPDHAARRFRLCAASLRRENPIQARFIWQEQTPDGAVACYPNRVVISMNPETGAVCHFVCTTIRDVVRAAPPLTAEAAQKLALVARPGARAARWRLSVIMQHGQARPVWLVELETKDGPDAVLVDAESGALVPFQES